MTTPVQPLPDHDFFLQEVNRICNSNILPWRENWSITFVRSASLSFDFKIKSLVLAVTAGVAAVVVAPAAYSQSKWYSTPARGTEGARIQAQLQALLGAVAALQQQVGEGTLPQGAVVAYNLSACPPGWTEFTAAAGRAILGSGTYPLNADDDGSNPATTYGLAQIGGRMNHVLTVAELPPHSHSLSANQILGTSYPTLSAAAGAHFGPILTPVVSSVVGSGAAVDIRAPFIALRYCQKD